MDEKDTINKISRLIEDSRKKKIIDYDTGLLNDVFESITGTSEEKFDRWSDRLIRVTARLENLYRDEVEKPLILKEIYEFFDEIELPYISSSVKDASVDIKYGRTITITRGDCNDYDISCPVELFNDIAQTIRQEQYIPLIAQIKKLFAKAMSILKDNNFSWHREGLITEINPEGE